MARPDPPEWVSPNPWHEIEALYHKVLDLFHVKELPGRAYPHALRLLRLLDKHDPNSEVLLGMSGRCVLAELDGDIPEAIRYRKMELAAVNKLLGEVAPDVLASMKMGPDDYSDRLDLLAGLYLDAGRYDDALAALAESEAFCKRHGIPFDGKDVRTEVKRAMRRKPAQPPRRAKAV